MAKIAIPNMTCGGCAKGVVATLGAAAPGADVTIDLERREVTVAAPDTAPLIAALRADGWEASPAPG
ncbi:MAG: heavy-metal-associated domain-containing protein [Pseudomonadota bacterium]